ncbi:hypothetical protein DTO217A2_8541 [Paecilomyces variotii]|nr:hypothetical protein DTO217A2_8541 [Paecilomyces variotii]
MKERVLWLDGLRGVASAIVALFHAKSFEPQSVLGFLFNSYWDEPAEENRRLIQLPPIRLLFSGASMVALFMVISGYAISLPLLQSREDTLTNNLASNVGFFRRLASAATRRIFRIYLPCIVIIFVSQFLYFCGIYEWEPPSDDWVWGLKPFTAPLSHIHYALWHVLHLLDISNHGIDINFVRPRPDFANLNYQLWTMPVEFRGSCMVYLMTLTLAFWTPRPRYLALIGVAAYWLYIGQWDLFAFVAGMLLGEGHVSDHCGPAGEIELPCNHSETRRTVTDVWTKFKVLIGRFLPAVSFVLVIYLLCMCHADKVSPEYRFLLAIQSPAWDHPEMFARCWRSIGATLAIYAIRESAFLQSPLNSRPVQYLGDISFPLYVIHVMVYFIFKRPVRSMLWFIMTQTPYPGTIEASRTHPVAFCVAFGGSVVNCLMIMVLVAELWNRFVDKKCMVLARRFEKWVTF